MPSLHALRVPQAHQRASYNNYMGQHGDSNCQTIRPKINKQRPNSDQHDKIATKQRPKRHKQQKQRPNSDQTATSSNQIVLCPCRIFCRIFYIINLYIYIYISSYPHIYICIHIFITNIFYAWAGAGPGPGPCVEYIW